MMQSIRKVPLLFILATLMFGGLAASSATALEAFNQTTGANLTARR